MPPPGRRGWAPTGFRRTSNGLASGNSRAEAALHALYEVIERDAVRGWPGAHPGARVDPDSVDDPGCAAMVAQLRAAGVTFEIGHLPSRYGVPCFGTWIWSADFPVTSLGFGAHSAPEVALSRALTEAAQSRLTAITGSREDLPPVYQQVRDGAGDRPPVRPATVTWAEVIASTAGDAAPPAELAAELTRLATTVTLAGGHEPLLVDLTTEDDFSVVRVIVPGAGSDLDRFHAPG
jgi:ribosomal protein S12 methylthiotransferase accessory factor